jgi:hypothetical protein
MPLFMFDAEPSHSPISRLPVNLVVVIVVAVAVVVVVPGLSECVRGKSPLGWAVDPFPRHTSTLALTTSRVLPARDALDQCRKTKATRMHRCHEHRMRTAYLIQTLATAKAAS